jgi:hypothetical protein
MHEGHPQSSDQFAISQLEMLKFGAQLEGVVNEQQEGGLVERTLGELEGRYEEAQIDLSRIKQELEQLHLDKARVEESIADTLNRLSDLNETDDSNGDIADDRDFILATNLRKQRMEARQLAKNIAALEDRIINCDAYIEANREYHAQLTNRPAVIKKILGHLAAAMVELENIPQIEPVPPMFNDVYKYESIIPDADLYQVAQLLDDSRETKSVKTISVPIVIPPPQPEREPSIEITPPPHPALRRATLPSGASKLFSN